MPPPRSRVSGIAGTLGEGEADLDQHPSGAAPETAAAPSAEPWRRGASANRSVQLLLALADEFFHQVRVHGHCPHDRSLASGVQARARASALARTMAGSRGSGGRTSRPGRWRRDGGLWIRIRFTVGHLLSRSCPSRPSASLRSSSGLVPRGTACVSAPGMGVTWRRRTGPGPHGVSRGTRGPRRSGRGGPGRRRSRRCRTPGRSLTRCLVRAISARRGRLRP